MNMQSPFLLRRVGDEDVDRRQVFEERVPYYCSGLAFLSVI